MLQLVYNKLVYFYRYSAAMEKTWATVFGATLLAWSDFLGKCEGMTTQAFSLKGTDTIFSGARLIDKQSGIWEKVKVRIESALIRFQFLEALLRLGAPKFVKSGEAKDLVERMQLSLDLVLSAAEPFVTNLGQRMVVWRLGADPRYTPDQRHE